MNNILQPAISHKRLGGLEFRGVAATTLGTLLAIVLSIVVTDSRPMAIGVIGALSLGILVCSVIPSALKLVRYYWVGRWWIPLLIALFTSSLNLTGVFQLLSSQPVGWSLRLGIVAIVALFLYSHMISTKTFVLKPLASGLFLIWSVFLLVNVASAIWSVNPQLTLYRTLEFAIDILVIGVIVRQVRDVRELFRLINWVWLLSGILLFSALIGVLVDPSNALPSMKGVLGFGVQGLYPAVSRNSLGQLAGILFVVGFSRCLNFRMDRWGYAVLVLCSLSFLLVTQTRSALVPLAIAVPLICLLSRRMVLFAFAAMSLLVVFLASGASSLAVEYLGRGLRQTELDSLTGRTIWWNLAFDQLALKPWTGFGGFVGWDFTMRDAGPGALTSAHNTFVEVLVGTSIWGVVPLVLIALLTFCIVLKKAISPVPTDSDARLLHSLSIEGAGVLVILLVRSYFTSNALIWHPSFEFLAMVALAEYIRSDNRMRRHLQSTILPGGRVA